MGLHIGVMPSCAEINHRMNRRDVITLLESFDLNSIIDRMEEAARSFDVSVELSCTDPDDSIYDTISQMPVDTGDVIVINQLDAETPRRGDGTRAMQAICAIADEKHAELVLEPFSGRTPTSILHKWYARFGFLRASNGWMYRRPAKTSTVQNDVSA